MSTTTRCRIINVPGSAGATGPAGADGVDGINAFTTVVGGFTMPAVGSTVLVEVVESGWIVPSANVGGGGEVDGQVIVVEFAGSFLATSVPDSTHVELYNLGYTGNVAPTAFIPDGAKVAPGGFAGSAGAPVSPTTVNYNLIRDVAPTVADIPADVAEVWTWKARDSGAMYHWDPSVAAWIP